MENEEAKVPLAVITGASTGIGLELAKQFAGSGFDIVIVSNSERIYEAALDLRSFGNKVYEFRYDLTRRIDIENFCDKIREIDRRVDVAVFNAGVGVGGEFLKTDFEEEINLINLNIVGTVYLTKLLLQAFIPDGGRIMFTSSIASDMPSSYEVIYGGSKAFIQSFANGLREELKEKNISVTTLLPGPTNTNFFARAHLLDTKVGSKEKFENEPEDVARQGFEALMKGQDEVISASMKTKFQGVVNKFLPEKVKAYIHRQMSEPGSAYH